ncbi:unnamed protein product [Ectocarpus sp. 6 AP-2014]
MRALLRSCGLTALLKLAGCQSFWVSARTRLAQHQTPSASAARTCMSFVEAEKVTGFARSRGPFRRSATRLASTAGAETTSTISTSSGPPTDAASSLEFNSEEAYHDHLEGQGKLPLGFRVGTDGLRFVPKEVPTEVTMNVTAIVLDEASIHGMT